MVSRAEPVSLPAAFSTRRLTFAPAAPAFETTTTMGLSGWFETSGTTSDAVGSTIASEDHRRYRASPKLTSPSTPDELSITSEPGVIVPAGIGKAAPMSAQYWAPGATRMLTAGPMAAP